MKRGTRPTTLVQGLPDKIKIFDTIYEIVYMDKVVDPGTNNYLRGQAHYISGKISISLKDYNGKERCPTLIWRTLWHEILHLVMDAVHRNYQTSQETDKEDLICMISTAINTVCFDNNLNFQREFK